MRTLSIFSGACIFLYIFLFAGRLSGQSRDASVRLAWDYSSLEKMADRGGYPRLLRLQDSAIMVVYETYTGNIQFKKSVDNGKSWSVPENVFSQFM